MKRALIDLSSVIWTCLMAGKDREFGKEVVSPAGKKVWVNPAEYGYDNTINHLTTVIEDLKIPPRQMIFVLEGENSKLGRQQVFPAYKSDRKDVPDLYEGFNGAKAMVLDLFLNLGAQVVTQQNVEADDILGYLAQKLDGERWIVSGDKDLAQCVGGDVHHWRSGVADENPFGPFPHHLIPVYIALVGDQSDKVPGAAGFGPKSFLELLAKFGDEGLEMMLDLIKRRKLGDLAEDLAEMPKLQKILDDEDNVYKSYELGRLWTEKVDTLRRPLVWKAGMVKPRELIPETKLRKYGGSVRLISQEATNDAFEFFSKHVNASPEIALDIETSTPPESDEWLERQNKEDGAVVDVFGSELTGMGITFGWNMQYTFYLTVDHLEEEGVTNISKAEVARYLKRIPKSKQIVVHNAQFELPVCYMELGELMGDDPEWHGFLPNVIDSRIMSSYADENRKAGLKGLSKDLLGYEQQTYEQVTTVEVYKEDWDGVGRIKAERPDVPDEDGSEPRTILTVQKKMNELTAQHVLSYGSDDPICTAALANNFRARLEIEDTWDVFMEVEQLPAYATAKAFVDGVDFSAEEMRKMSEEDDQTYDKAWATLRDYLIKIGFAGTICPTFEKIDAASIKEAFLIMTGQKLGTQVRTPSKLAKLIRQECGGVAFEESAYLLAVAIETDDLGMLNQLVQSRFKGEPEINLGSPKQVAHLLYDRIGIPVSFINDLTTNEKVSQPALADAVRKFKKWQAGHEIHLSEDELKLVRKKATSDDSAIEYAIKFNTDVVDAEAKAALLALGSMKKVMTRRSLFYNNYWNLLHWKDGKIHASLNQSLAVTRRYSSSGPNLQQLPKKGEGVRFRGCFKPPHKWALIGSIDFKGQELRLAAERSQDKNLLSCYVGDNLRDVHHITASGAIRLQWSPADIRTYFEKYGADLQGRTDADYQLFVKLHGLGKEDPVGKAADDIRKDSKNVNFAAQFGAKAVKIAETLTMLVSDAQKFLDARSAMFPDVDKAAKRAEEECKRLGYATTMMGARRHLREGIMSDDSWASSRAARQAWNMEIQGSAAEMMKLAIGRFWKSGVMFTHDVRLIAPIHDELVISAHRDHLCHAMKVLHDCMTAPYADMQVPILGSLSIGKDFAHQIECGDEYIETNLVNAMNDIFNERKAA